jgi:hypothetical protein
MNELLTAMLTVGALSALRHDDVVSRQGVMNHQTSAHFMDLSFIRDAVEMSIPESYAVQGLALSQLPAQAAGMNLGSQTPK